MSEIANIYDNGPISPVAQINENLGVWTEGVWQFFRIENFEGMPRSRPLMADIVALNNAANLPANGTLAAVTPLQLQPGGVDKRKEILHLRWEPLDDVEGLLQEPAPARYNPQGAVCTVTPFTALRDPWLATTTFFIIGVNKDPRVNAFNPNPVAVPRARFVFWGYRYVVEPLQSKPTVARYLPTSAFTL